MWQFLTTENIVPGIIEGLILALILGLYRWVSFCKDRRRDRKYITTTINRNMEEMRKEGHFKNSELGEKVPIEQIQKALFDSMRRDVYGYLDLVGTTISPEEKINIRKPFKIFDFFDSHKAIPPLRIYENSLIEPLKKIKWLKLD